MEELFTGITLNLRAHLGLAASQVLSYMSQCTPLGECAVESAVWVDSPLKPWRPWSTDCAAISPAPTDTRPGRARSVTENGSHRHNRRFLETDS